MSSFRQHYDSANPERWPCFNRPQRNVGALKSKGKKFDEVETRTAMADLIVNFAAQGQRDPKKLKGPILFALPRPA
jgi:hypothetical protein